MAFTYLSPSATDRSITFIVPKEIDPYFVQFYQATKLAGETPSAFILRLLGNKAKAWYAYKQVSDNNISLGTEATAFIKSA